MSCLSNTLWNFSVSNVVHLSLSENLCARRGWSLGRFGVGCISLSIASWKLEIINTTYNWSVSIKRNWWIYYLSTWNNKIGYQHGWKLYNIRNRCETNRIRTVLTWMLPLHKCKRCIAYSLFLPPPGTAAQQANSRYMSTAIYPINKLVCRSDLYWIQVLIIKYNYYVLTVLCYLALRYFQSLQFVKKLVQIWFDFLHEIQIKLDSPLVLSFIATSLFLMMNNLI